MSDDSIKTFMVAGFDKNDKALAIRFISGTSVWSQETEIKLEKAIQSMVRQIRRNRPPYRWLSPKVVRDGHVYWQVYLVTCKNHGFPKYLRDYGFPKYLRDWKNEK